MEKNDYNVRSVFVGKVVSIPGAKTIKVAVVRYQLHSKYRKKYKITKYFLVHDEQSAYAVGDEVRFVASRPKSKQKTFEVVLEK